jgi:uncharacterized protein (TIGR02611 family)
MRDRIRRWARAVAAASSAVRDRAYATAIGRILWRVAITVVGVLVIIAGIILLPLPGPGWVVIFAGLGLLATEYDWARRLLRAVRAKAAELAAKAGRNPCSRRRARRSTDTEVGAAPRGATR